MARLAALIFSRRQRKAQLELQIGRYVSEGLPSALIFGRAFTTRKQIAEDTFQNKKGFVERDLHGYFTVVTEPSYRTRIKDLIPDDACEWVPGLNRTAEDYRLQHYMKGYQYEGVTNTHAVHLMTMMSAFRRCPNCEFEDIFGHDDSKYPVVVVCHEARGHSLGIVKSYIFTLIDIYIVGQLENLRQPEEGEVVFPVNTFNPRIALAKIFWFMAWTRVWYKGWKSMTRMICNSLAKQYSLPYCFSLEGTRNKLFFEAWCYPDVEEFIVVFPSLF